MMRSKTRWTLAGCMALAALGAVALSVGVAEAGKPGGGGPIPPGTIYFNSVDSNGSFGGLWSMNPDGSGKTALPASVRGVPSNQVHGGAHWFLYANSGIHAIREDGSSDVQLSTTGGLELTLAWGRDDSFVSFQWWDAAAGNVCRISRIDIAFDANGVPSAAGGPVTVSGISGIANTSWLGAHTWSPSGDRVAWSGQGNLSSVNLNVTTVATGATTSIASNTGFGLAWSPDGARILFRSEQGLDTIDPSGANQRNIVQKPTRNGHFLSGRDWSPDSAAILYGLSVWGYPSHPTRDQDPVLLDADVYRVSADGSRRQNLTSGSGFLALPIAWR